MLRIAILADDHMLSESLGSRSFFPAYYDSLPDGVRESQYERHRSIVHACRQQVCDNLAGNRPWDLIVHLGDMTSGWLGYGIEHGDVHGLVQESCAEYQGIAQIFRCAWGDHDLGSAGKYTTSLASVQACDALSPLFWHCDLPAVRFIGISVSLQDERISDPKMLGLRAAQEDYVREQLESLNGKRWILFTHHLELGSLSRIVAGYLPSMLHCVYGHRHAPWFGRAVRTAGTLLPFSTASALMRKSVLCPSVAPLWWTGGGMIEATTTRSGRFTMRPDRVVLSRGLQRDIHSMPFSNFVRGALAVQKEQLRQRFRKR